MPVFHVYGLKLGSNRQTFPVQLLFGMVTATQIWAIVTLVIAPPVLVAQTVEDAPPFMLPGMPPFARSLHAALESDIPVQPVNCATGICELSNVSVPTW